MIECRNSRPDPIPFRFPTLFSEGKIRTVSGLQDHKESFDVIGQRAKFSSHEMELSDAK